MNLEQLLIVNSSKFIPVFGDVPKEKIYSLDLSVNNRELMQLLSALPIGSDLRPVGAYIDSILTANSAVLGVGGYLERRAWYQRSEVFGDRSDVEDVRTVHLGIDLWRPAGTPVYLPLDGELVTAVNNNNALDYGPTLIFRHTLGTECFYSLFGHMTLGTLATHPIGTSVAAGSLIGELGDYDVNGGWPPHLHFQVMKSLPDLTGDYPGVCSEADLEHYSNECPDPLIMCGYG